MDFRLGTPGPLSPFHAVQRNNQSFDVHLCLCLKNRIGLLNGFSGCSDILDDNDPVSILQPASQKDAGIPMVFGLLAVGTVTDIPPVKLADGCSRDNGKRNSLIGRSEKNVKIQAVMIVYRPRIILSESAELGSRHISPRIHKKGRPASALQCKITEFQYLAVQHEPDKLFFIFFHTLLPFCFVVFFFYRTAPIRSRMLSIFCSCR